MKMRVGFTMIELVFVIVVIGILATIAVPKFAATRDDAIISSARATVASIRTGMATLRQKNILKGDFDDINASVIKSEVLDYGLKECSGSERACWVVDESNNKLTYRLPDGSDVDFKVENNRFVCDDPSSSGCKLLTK